MKVGRLEVHSKWAPMELVHAWKPCFFHDGHSFGVRWRTWCVLWNVFDIGTPAGMAAWCRELAKRAMAKKRVDEACGYLRCARRAEEQA